MMVGGFVLLMTLSLVSSFASLTTALGYNDAILFERVLGAALSPLFLAGPFIVLPLFRSRMNPGVARHRG